MGPCQDETGTAHFFSKVKHGSYIDVHEKYGVNVESASDSNEKSESGVKGS